jgi:hypothetical protein
LCRSRTKRVVFRRHDARADDGARRDPSRRVSLMVPLTLTNLNSP